MVANTSVRLEPFSSDVRPCGPRASRNRFFRAYWTTFQVLFSYLFTSLGRRIFGDNWYEARIKDVHRRNALRVETTIIKLQGLFIKVGQMLSIMANFLPDQFRTGLEGLQDQVPPRAFSDIEHRIFSDLGRPVDQVFARFERRPL